MRSSRFLPLAAIVTTLAVLAYPATWLRLPPRPDDPSERVLIVRQEAPRVARSATLQGCTLELVETYPRNCPAGRDLRSRTQQIDLGSIRQMLRLNSGTYVLFLPRKGPTTRSESYHACDGGSSNAASNPTPSAIFQHELTPTEIALLDRAIRDCGPLGFIFRHF